MNIRERYWSERFCFLFKSLAEQLDCPRAVLAERSQAARIIFGLQFDAIRAALGRETARAVIEHSVSEMRRPKLPERLGRGAPATGIDRATGIVRSVVKQTEKHRVVSPEIRALVLQYQSYLEIHDLHPSRHAQFPDYSPSQKGFARWFVRGDDDPEGDAAEKVRVSLAKALRRSLKRTSGTPQA